eukprot:11299246-Alexandrium_andersonii.AAC.1
MSASLVGSEMCIRDSASPLLAGVPPVFPALSSLACALLRSLALFCALPVSYTHLTLPTICSV